MFTLEQKTLRIIQMLAEGTIYRDDMTKLEKELNDQISLIFRVAHTVASPDCQKNHPKWTEEFNELLKKHDEETEYYASKKKEKIYDTGLPFGWKMVE